MSASDKVLFSAPRGDREEIRVVLGEYQGKPTLGIRLWFLGRSDEWMPSQKGCSIRRDELSGVITALQEAAKGLGAEQQPPRTAGGRR